MSAPKSEEPAEKHALVPHDNGHTKLSPAIADWDSDYRRLVTLTVLRPKNREATPVELSLFAEQVQRTGLNPFLKQIYGIYRYDKRAKGEVMHVQVGIDGFRLVAERTGKYEGQTTATWCGPDGHWTDVWPHPDPPVAARVGVYKKGRREPTYAVAHWREYVQTYDGRPAGKWADMPANQLAKCLPGRALIDTDLGPLPIGLIVRDRMPVKVRSIDPHTGRETWAAVVNWWRNGGTSSWIRLHAPTGVKGSKGVRLTAEHPIWTPNGWQPAGTLRPGDMVGATTPTLSDDQRQIITGGLLGDGGLTGGSPAHCGTLHYAESHSAQQESYLRWKGDALASLGIVVTTGTQDDGTGKRHGVVRMRTRSIPALEEFRELDPVELLPRLDDLGVAVWLMDDAGIKRTGAGGARQRPYIRLYCCGFPVSFADAAVDFFATRYGVRAEVLRRAKNPYLSIGADGTARLLDRLARWLRYDPCTNDKQWLGGDVEQGEALGSAFVPLAGVERVTTREPEGRYDIEVEDTHTFVYRGMIVSNCAEALALRKCFPAELSGLYTPDEMAQADSQPSVAEGHGDGRPRGLDLGPDVEAVLTRASELGHAALADRGSVEMLLDGQPPEHVARWVAAATDELDAVPADADVVCSTMVHEVGHLTADLRGRGAQTPDPSPDAADGPQAPPEAAETVDSPRPVQRDPDAVEQMRAQANAWLDHADSLDARGKTEEANRARDDAATLMAEIEAASDENQIGLEL